MIHLPIEETRVLVVFGDAYPLAGPVILETSFIEILASRTFLIERETISQNSEPVAILMMAEVTRGKEEIKTKLSYQPRKYWYLPIKKKKSY